MLTQPLFEVFVSGTAAALKYAERQVSQTCLSYKQLRSRDEVRARTLEVLLRGVVYETDNCALLINYDETSAHGH
jgi:hypothetical protein